MRLLLSGLYLKICSLLPLLFCRENKTVNRSVADAQKLPLNIRERDLLYQFHRVVLFDRLLKGYPHTKTMLVREARNDIPPLYRPSIWSAILDVQVPIYRMMDTQYIYWYLSLMPLIS